MNIILNESRETYMIYPPQSQSALLLNQLQFQFPLPLYLSKLWDINCNLMVPSKCHITSNASNTHLNTLFLTLTLLLGEIHVGSTTLKMDPT